jgi:hypothetical protein
MLRLYASAKANLKFMEISSGLRLEYNNAVKSETDHDDMKKTYLNIFPYISISKPFNESAAISLFYRRTISRPSFSNFNTQFVYRDSLTYLTGNPDLKPMFSDRAALDLTISKLNILLGYNVYSNRFILEDIRDESNPAVTISTLGNMKDKYKQLTVSLSYSIDYSFFSTMLSLNYNKPYLKLPFNGTVIEMNKAMYLIQVSGNIKFFENTKLNYSFVYSSKGNRDNMELKSFSNFSLELNQHLLNKKLMLSISVEDIFNTSKGNRYTSYGDNIMYVMDSNPNTRAFAFTLRYNWGLAKGRIQEKISSMETINRL